jgi:hypothetical protein
VEGEVEKAVSLVLKKPESAMLKNARDRNQETPMDWAMRKQNNDIIRLLH